MNLCANVKRDEFLTSGHMYMRYAYNPTREDAYLQHDVRYTTQFGRRAFEMYALRRYAKLDYTHMLFSMLSCLEMLP